MEEKEEIIAEIMEFVIDWLKLKTICGGIIPCVVQDIKTKGVLLLAYVNQEALSSTLKTGLATFWSTSRKCLWVKGRESGNVLYVLEVRVNCELNSLLYLVSLARGGACHVKDRQGEYRKSCFYRKIENGKLIFLEEEGEEEQP